MKTDTININIWDDFYDDGYVPEGEIQETYAYIEGKLNEEECKNILELLKLNIEQLAKPEWNLELELNYHDSAKIYPNLVGTEHEFCLYKRWQLQFKHLSHEACYYLVEALGNKKLKYLDTPLVIYSES